MASDCKALSTENPLPFGNDAIYLVAADAGVDIHIHVLMTGAGSRTRMTEVQVFRAIAQVAANHQGVGLVRQGDGCSFLGGRRQGIMVQPVLDVPAVLKQLTHHVLKFDFADVLDALPVCLNRL